ncbi:MAG: cupin domain-containing protein [Chromatiales bacterium]|jgi:quercetin dioxygenase-like cupin family protein|nr:cupin domain-containing protein [Chromatiales bacterium]
MTVRSFAVQPNQAESYWQPVPANGFVEVHVSRHRTNTDTPFESGIQEVAPGSFVRQHAHDGNEELILVMEGKGVALIEGEEHAMQPGTTLYLASQEKHKFTNTADSPLRFFWVLMPGGLSDFFKAIGQARTGSDSAPAPFPRPDDVASIEASTVFVKPQ